MFDGILIDLVILSCKLRWIIGDHRTYFVKCLCQRNVVRVEAEDVLGVRDLFRLLEEID